MTNHLNQKPAIGIISGGISWMLYVLKQVFTSDDILKYVAGIGIWVGALVALMTMYLRWLEIRKKRSEK